MKPDHYNQILKLFIECNHIRDLSNKLLEEADIIERHAMNAAIAAGHTGGHIKTFSEIARLIRDCALKLSVEIKDMKVEVNIVVNQTLSAMIKSNQVTSLQKAADQMKEGDNLDRVFNIIEKYQTDIEYNRQEVTKKIHEINKTIVASSLLQDRIWAVITRLRIEASSMESSDQIFILSIADEVSKSIDYTKIIIGMLLSIIKGQEGEYQCIAR